MRASEVPGAVAAGMACAAALDLRVEDPDALRIDPDPASRSGRSVRTIGSSSSAGHLVTVITVEEAGIIYGVNGWKSNEIDIRRYREERQ
jgi:hypothetical protein